MWIKIEEEIFCIENISVQYTLLKHTNIYIEIDIRKYDYYSFFINLYENNRGFDMSFCNEVAKHFNNKFLAKGCHIKTMDIIFNTQINLNITCNSLLENIMERRDDVLEQILENKSNK
jgi:hypothetical protein